jgi:hypothetical protein
MDRKNELIDLRDDEDHEFQGHEELELEELEQLEADLGCTLEAAYQNGAIFIDEDYFVEYAKELAYDIGVVSDDLEWPNTFIDWDAAADALKVDYTEVEFDGNTYLVRL